MIYFFLYYFSLMDLIKLIYKILANGKSYNSSRFFNFSGYVMQDDLLFETLTPRGLK